MTNPFPPRTSGAPSPYDSPRLCLDPQTITFNPASPAAQRARNEPMGSVLKQHGKP